MLAELRVKDFAVIDDLELSLRPGFCVITGETGAGKSILVDAVELLLGGRADPVFVRAGKQRSIIEGTIHLQGRNRQAALAILERENLLDDDDPHILSVSRELRARGRSSARVNGVAVSANLLRELGELLIDIHGQSEHLSLLRQRYHIDLLDRYADLLDARAGLAALVADLSDVQAEISHLHESGHASQRRAELLRHEIDQIHAAGLEADEEASLRTERNRLANSEQLASLAAQAAALLNGDERGAGLPVVDALMQVEAALAKLADIDPDLGPDHQLAQESAQNAQELALTLARYASDIDFDPARLDELEERLELIRSFKRRYQAQDVAEILAYAESATRELDGIENNDKRLLQLRMRERELLTHIGDISARMSRARADAGRALGGEIAAELADLRMERSRFQVRLSRAEHPAGCIVGERRYKFDAKGLDDVEFMLSANPGQALLPLAKVASGGEAARIMLAMKRVLTAADQTPTLIFDEVDQGIGGRIGAVVGQKLWRLARDHQVLCVTHLPQLAVYADTHLQVQKSLSAAGAATELRALRADEERVGELAAMLGTAGAAGRQSARELLAAARVWKGTLVSDIIGRSSAGNDHDNDTISNITLRFRASY